MGQWRTTCLTVCSSAPHSQSAESAVFLLLLLLSDELMNCCSVSANGCLRMHSNPVDRWALSVSTLHGTACWRECDSIAAKLNRLDVCEDTKIVRWCKTHASSYSSQGIVDDRSNGASVSTAPPGRSAVLGYWMDQGQGGWSQRCCPSSGVRANESPQECDTWCQLFVKSLEVSAICEGPDQSYSWGIWAQSKRTGFRFCGCLLAHV